MPRRFAPRNDSPNPLSFRGGPTGRRGNPSFLQWTGVRAAEVVGPYGCGVGSAQQRADVGIGPYALRGTARRGRRALRVVAESRRDCPGQRRTAERLRRGREGWVGIGAEITPKGVINLGQSLSHGCAVTAPFAQGSLWAGGCGLPRRFASRNDSPDPLSFRGGPTGRRGNPSFLRWTGARAAEVVGPYGTKRKPAATATAAL